LNQLEGKVLFRFPKSANFYCINGLVKDGIKQGFVFAPFIGTPQTICGKVLKATSADFNLSARNSRMEFDEETTIPKITYLNLIAELSQKLKANAKVVISRREIHAYTKGLKEILKDVAKSFPTAFIYALQINNEAIWLGATPETILKKSGNRFSTHSLAGTKMPHEKWTNKEIGEQQIVSTYIQKKLELTPATNLTSTATFTAKAANIQHLKSVYTWNSNACINTFLEVLHPTPAVCGFPQKASLDLIHDNEGYNRELYTGYVGLILNNNLACLFVNLRCTKLLNKKAYIYAGGGITHQSNPSSEWKETERKMAPLLKILSTEENINAL